MFKNSIKFNYSYLHRPNLKSHPKPFLRVQMLTNCEPPLQALEIISVLVAIEVIEATAVKNKMEPVMEMRAILMNAHTKVPIKCTLNTRIVPH